MPGLSAGGDLPFLKKDGKESMEFGGISHGRGKERKTTHPIRTIFFGKVEILFETAGFTQFQRAF